MTNVRKALTEIRDEVAWHNQRYYPGYRPMVPEQLYVTGQNRHPPAQRIDQTRTTDGDRTTPLPPGIEAYNLVAMYHSVAEHRQKVRAESMAKGSIDALGNPVGGFVDYVETGPERVRYVDVDRVTGLRKGPVYVDQNHAQGVRVALLDDNDPRKYAPPPAEDPTEEEVRAWPMPSSEWERLSTARMRFGPGAFLPVDKFGWPPAAERTREGSVLCDTLYDYETDNALVHQMGLPAPGPLPARFAARERERYDGGGPGGGPGGPGGGDSGGSGDPSDGDKGPSGGGDEDPEGVVPESKSERDGKEVKMEEPEAVGVRIRHNHNRPDDIYSLPANIPEPEFNWTLASTRKFKRQVHERKCRYRPYPPQLRNMTTQQKWIALYPAMAYSQTPSRMIVPLYSFGPSMSQI